MRKSQSPFPYDLEVAPVEPPPPLMLVMLPPEIAQKVYELMVGSDATLARDLAAIRRKYDRRRGATAPTAAAP